MLTMYAQPSNQYHPELLELTDSQSSMDKNRIPQWWRRRENRDLEKEFFLVSVTGSSSAYSNLARELTEESSLDIEMLWLETLGQIDDDGTFAIAVEAIDWRNRTPEDFQRGIQLALSKGAHLVARQLAESGAQQYPENTGLKKYARILAPARVLDSHLLPDPNAAANVRWLKLHGDKYLSQWVALRAGELLSAAPTMEKLLQIIGNPKDTDIMVTKVY